MKKLINGIAIILIGSAICTAAASIIKVAKLEENVKSDHEMIKETNDNVKEIRTMLVNHMVKE